MVSVEFLGLYYLSAIDAQSIVDPMKDGFLWFQIPLAKLCGQCYDGCSTMARAKVALQRRSLNWSPELCSTIVMGMHSILASVTPSNSHRL